tara:strand:- start:5386 stop:6108 length:723 start_codon:yes stop_codon:yes gene_type:complete
MNIELRNWYLCNLELSQYLPKTKFNDKSSPCPPRNEEVDIDANNKSRSTFAKQPDYPRSKKDNIDKHPPATLSEKNIKNTNIYSSNVKTDYFRFACWQPAKNLIIFNEMNPDVLPCNDLSKLLSNILSSIGYMADSFPEPTIIDCPPGAEGTDIAEASKMLLAFIDNRVKNDNTCLILVMGKTVFDVFSPPNLSYSDFLGKKIDINDQYKALILQSLQENLHSSEAKRGTWKAIKSIINK